MKSLTQRQREIFNAIKQHLATHGYPPTVRDIGKSVGLSSSSTVHGHLANLQRLGLIRRDPTKPRAIEILDESADAHGQKLLPLLGQVAGGEPTLAEEDIEAYVAVPEVAGARQGHYLLRVRGNSMRDAGIFDRDLIVVRQQSVAQNGEIVVAMVGSSQATVKHFFDEGDHIRLQPANDDFEPILSQEVRVLGVTVGLLRSY
jgi:repressor LexA